MKRIIAAAVGVVLSLGLASPAIATGDDFEPYRVNACWQMDNPNMSDPDSIEWPQTNVDKGTETEPATCPKPPKCKGAKFQYDWYWIRDADDESYFASLTSLGSPDDDAPLEPHDYSVTLVPAKGDCEPPVVKKRAWIRFVPYCNTVRIEGRKNVNQIKHTTFGERGHRYKVWADLGAYFANGKQVVVRKVWEKNKACGDSGTGS